MQTSSPINVTQTSNIENEQSVNHITDQQPPITASKGKTAFVITLIIVLMVVGGILALSTYLLLQG